MADEPNQKKIDEIWDAISKKPGAEFITMDGVKIQAPSGAPPYVDSVEVAKLLQAAMPGLNWQDNGRGVISTDALFKEDVATKLSEKFLAVAKKIDKGTENGQPNYERIKDNARVVNENGSFFERLDTLSRSKESDSYDDTQRAKAFDVIGSLAPGYTETDNPIKYNAFEENKFRESLEKEYSNNPDPFKAFLTDAQNKLNDLDHPLKMEKSPEIGKYQLEIYLGAMDPLTALELKNPDIQKQLREVATLALKDSGIDPKSRQDKPVQTMEEAMGVPSMKEFALANKIQTAIDAKDGPENELKKYLGPKAVGEMAKLNFSVDKAGNAVADSKPLVNTIITEMLEIKDKLTTEELRAKGVEILGGANRGGEKAFDFIEQEAARLVNERFIPQIMDVTPLNSLSKLTQEEFEKTDGKKLGRIHIKILPYEKAEHKEYLANPLVENSKLENPEAGNITIHKSQVERLKEFGFDVKEAEVKQKDEALDKKGAAVDRLSPEAIAQAGLPSADKASPTANWPDQFVPDSKGGAVRNNNLAV